MKKIAALVETTGDRAAATVKSVSMVFSVPQQQRAVSAAEEFCVQIHAIKACHKPSKSNTMSVSGGNSKEILNYLLIN